MVKTNSDLPLQTLQLLALESFLQVPCKHLFVILFQYSLLVVAGSEKVGVQAGAGSCLLVIGFYPEEESVGCLIRACFEGENHDFRPAKVTVSAGQAEI